MARSNNNSTLLIVAATDLMVTAEHPSIMLAARNVILSLLDPAVVEMCNSDMYLFRDHLTQTMAPTPATEVVLHHLFD